MLHNGGRFAKMSSLQTLMLCSKAYECHEGRFGFVPDEETRAVPHVACATEPLVFDAAEASVILCSQHNRSAECREWQLVDQNKQVGLKPILRNWWATAFLFV